MEGIHCKVIVPFTLTHCQFDGFLAELEAQNEAQDIDRELAASYATEKRRPELGAAQSHYFGGSVPRYAEIEIMSSSGSFATGFFINSAALPALDPF